MDLQYGNVTDLRETHRSDFNFTYSDLVISFPPPAEISLPTNHYDGQRFFAYTRELFDHVGHSIYVADSGRAEALGSFYASNLFASYEVEHWPGAERQMIWSRWIVETAQSLASGRPIPSIPRECRSLLRELLQDEKLGRQRWLFHHIQTLESTNATCRIFESIGRSPCEKIHVEVGNGIEIRRSDEKTRRTIPYARADTLARYKEVRVHESLFRISNRDVLLLVSCVRRPRSLVGKIVEEGARTPFDENGLYAPAEPRHPVSKQQETHDNYRDGTSSSEGDSPRRGNGNGGAGDLNGGGTNAMVLDPPRRGRGRPRGSGANRGSRKS